MLQTYIASDASTRKRGVYAVFDVERRPSAAFIRTCNVARRYPLEIGTPRRLVPPSCPLCELQAETEAGP